MQIEPRILENDIVRLEPLTGAHREALRPLAAESELWALTSIRGDGEFFDAWFDLMLSGQARGDQISHLVRRQSDGAALGNAFENGAERVEPKTHHKNKRSQNAMLKMGATREGVLRRQILSWTGEWRDSVYFSVLREEWPAARAGLEARLGA